MSVSDGENPVHWDGDAANLAQVLTPILQEIEQQRLQYIEKKRRATNMTLIAVGICALTTIIVLFISQQPGVFIFGLLVTVIIAFTTWYLLVEE